MDNEEFNSEFDVLSLNSLSKSEIALQLYLAYLSNPHVDPTKMDLDLIYLAKKIYALDIDD